ncbi:MAG: hypothetical protein JSS40_10765 [Proteobacteria bacterium]|nr:hypothetical protein [Pseudomonadota bacterium]
MHTKVNLLAAAALLALGAAASPAKAAGDATATTASIDTEAHRLDRDVVGQGPMRVQRRIGADFSGWAGSTDNANALVAGLREGKPITLVADPSAPPGTVASTTFTPPTRPMGYGNVYISLALARARLAAQGITSPTPLQLQTALVGGSATQPKGVLQMRSDGMGWGRIAQAYDLKLGPVMAGLKSAHQSLNPAGSGTTGWSHATGRAESATLRANSSGGIVTAAGTPAATSGYRDFSPGGTSHAHAVFSNSGTRGIVNAGGAGAGPGNGQARGHFK